MTRPSRLYAPLLVLAFLAAACSSDGRDLAEPLPGATTTSRPPATTMAADADAGVEVPAATTPAPTEPAALEGLTGLAVRSDSFRPGEPIPPRNTCEGAGISPSIRIENIPPEAVELALIAEELTNPFVHWVVWGIDPASPNINEAMATGQLPMGLNSLGQQGWAPPCPSDPGLHQFRFTVHAMSEALGLESGADPNSTIGAIDAATIDQASITAIINVN
ncbi:MAG: YbhB/YbcL family Raf kinase inhibitor-like protein [Actinomycetia bacterium]|nr:YbhB/YbcL family Raf kinase inhibitor-like protein [Actinomycetes bacterium]